MKLGFKDKEFNEHIRLILLASLIGFFAGLASVGFKLMIRFFQGVFWRSESIISAVASQPWYITVLIPALGGLIISPIIYYGAREAKGHGVPEIIEALFLRGGRIRAKVVAVKALASSICIGSGGSIGREGPIVQISSSLASSLSRMFRINEKGMRTLVAAGAGAGIGATFNAPIAGALFAVEILLGEFGVFSFGPIIVSSVIGTLTSRLISGDFASFTVPKYTLVSGWEIGPYIILGLICGLIAILFVKTLYFFEDIFENSKIHPLITPVIGGFLVGLIGLKFPQIFGVSYGPIDACLQNQVLPLLAFVLVFMKIVGTSLTLGSGGSGGIFAPSLFLGAMSGNFIGSFFHNMFPTAVSSPGAFSLVGMGAVVAAATQAPITAIIIIFELTNDYKIILPLMLSCIIASVLAAGIQRDTIYTMKLSRRGLRFKEGRELNILRSLYVKDYISEDYARFLNNDHLGQIINQAIGGKHHTFQIVDGENSYIGSFSLNHIKNVILDKDLVDDLIIAQDMVGQTYTIGYDDNLEKAMKLFGSTDVSELAVIRDQKFAGVIKRKEIIEAYNHEISKREATSSLIQKFKFSEGAKTHEIAAGYKLIEMEAPPEFWNKSLKELNLKARFRIDVLLIKRQYPPQTLAIPPAEEIIKEGDQLILAGLDESLAKLSNNNLDLSS